MTSSVGGQPLAAKSRRYPLWLWIFAIVVMLLTSLPYLLGFAVEGDGWRFTGFVFGVEDGNSYMAKMLRGADGDWLFRTPYTAWPQDGVVAFAPYLLLGKLTSPPAQHEQLVALFHLWRILGGVLYILACYDFLALFIKGERWRVWGVALAALGGGLGWLLILLGKGSWLGSLPLDMYSPETFGFLSIYGLPHLAVARALLLWGLRVYLVPELSVWKNRSGFFIGLLWLVMGLMQPLAVVLSWAILGAHWGVLLLQRIWWRWKSGDTDWDSWWNWFQRWLWIVGVTSPLVVYTVWAFNSDPVLRQWTAQNLILSPHPLHYLAAYGLLIPFGIMGANYLLREKRDAYWLPVAWSVALPVLVYAPYPLQRRLADGYWVALIAMVLAFFDQVGDFTHGSIAVPGRNRDTGGVNLKFHWILAFSFPTTLLLLVGGINAVRTPQVPIFRPRAEIEAFLALDQISNESDDSPAVVLASFETGNAMPAWTPAFVVIGHGPESVDLAKLRPRVESFYAEPTSNTERIELLRQFEVDFLFWGPLERQLGDWDPSGEACLQVVYEQDEYHIFAVNLTNQLDK